MAAKIASTMTDMLVVMITVVLFPTFLGAKMNVLEQPLCPRGEPTSLRLLALLPETGDTVRSQGRGEEAVAVRLGLEFAVEQINNRSDLLPCHNLKLVYRETGCTLSTVVNTAVGLTSGLFPSDGNTVAGIIGPVCLIDTRLASFITSKPELQLILLHSSGTNDISSGTQLSTNALDLLGSSQLLVDLLGELIKKSGWQNIAILFEDTRLFYASLTESFISRISDRQGRKVNIRYMSNVAPTFYPLDAIWNSKARIVFLFTSVVHSRRILCLAHHMKLVYPAYQWVITNQRLDDFTGQEVTFTYAGKEYSCSLETLVSSSLNRALFIGHQVSTTLVDDVLFANTTLKGFLDSYKQRVNDYNNNYSIANHRISISPTYYVYNLYDAVWAWAIVLDELTRMFDNEEMVFDYGNAMLTKIMLDKFYSINFQGVSGSVYFMNRSGHGHVVRPANLYQIVERTEKIIAYSNGSGVIQPSDHNIIIDTVPDVVVIVTFPHIGLVGFFITVQCIELTIVLVLHFFTVLYRNTKLVKASSPKLVHAAYFGVYTFIFTMLLYTSFFSKVHSATVGVLICQAVWAWLMPLSFTMAMGIVSLRTWRLYRIFKHYLNPGRYITNTALLMSLLVMMSVDILIGTIWTAVDTMQFDFIEYLPNNVPANEIFYDQSCFSHYNTLWLGIVYLYKFILLSVMVVLSLLTRKIPNQTFATTTLRVFSYTFSMVMVVGFLLYYLFVYLDPRSHGGPILLIVTLNIMLLLYMWCILAPPLVPVIQDKLRKKLYRHVD